MENKKIINKKIIDKIYLKIFILNKKRIKQIILNY